MLFGAVGHCVLWNYSAAGAELLLACRMRVGALHLGLALIKRLSFFDWNQPSDSLIGLHAYLINLLVLLLCRGGGLGADGGNLAFLLVLQLPALIHHVCRKACLSPTRGCMSPSVGPCGTIIWRRI